MTETRTVRIASGPVVGRRLDGVTRFAGVPYAAGPVGPLRFRPPEPHPGWSEPRDCTDAAPNAPQVVRLQPDVVDGAPLVGTGWKKGDDFLNAWIWTPDETASGLPVMVFIHGGAFIGGAPDAAVTDGAAFARSGVVLVSITYRMGVEGFLPIEGAPTNLGLRDQLFALRWVRENAAAFGGDPDRVTVFGESAGAMSVANLVASPLAEGLFRRAIVQSGHGDMVRPIPVARRLTERLAKALKIAPTVEGFRSRSIEQCLDAQAKISLPTARIDLRDDRGLEPAYGLSRFLPVYGDDVLPEHPRTALAKGVGAGVEVLIGTNLDEMNIYLVPPGVRRKIGGLISWLFLRRSIRRAGAILKAYKGPGKRPGDVLADAMTDLVFRAPARTFADARETAAPGRTWFYEFDWKSPAFDGQMGACHALELAFVFDTLDTIVSPKGIGGTTRPPQALADRMHRAWVGFARGEGLPWAPWSRDGRAVRRLAADETIADPPMAAARFLP